MAARKLIGQILKEASVIHEGMVQEALAIQREKGGRLGEILIGLEHISPIDLARALADQGRTIRIPVHLVETLNRITRTRVELEHRLGRKALK